MKNKVLLLLLIASAGLHAQTAENAKFTLQQAIDFAIKNGYSVKNAATDRSEEHTSELQSPS